MSTDLLSSLVIARDKRLTKFQDAVSYFVEHQYSWLAKLNPFRSTISCPNLLYAPKDHENLFDTTYLLVRPSEWKSQMVYDSNNISRDTVAIALFFHDILKPTLSAYQVQESVPLYIDYGLKLDWIIKKKMVFAAVPINAQGFPTNMIRIYYMGATSRGLIEWCSSTNTVKQITKRPFAIDLVSFPWFTTEVLKDYELLFMGDKFDDPIGYCVPPISSELLGVYNRKFLEKLQSSATQYNKESYPRTKEIATTE